MPTTEEFNYIKYMLFSFGGYFGYKKIYSSHPFLPSDSVFFFSLSMACVISGMQIARGRTERFVPEIIPNVTQIHGLVSHVRTGSMP